MSTIAEKAGGVSLGARNAAPAGVARCRERRRERVEFVERAAWRRRQALERSAADRPRLDADIAWLGVIGPAVAEVIAVERGDDVSDANAVEEDFGIDQAPRATLVFCCGGTGKCP